LRAVRGREHVRVAEALEVLRLPLDAVRTETTTAEVVGLSVAGDFIEAGVVIPVVQEIDVVEELRDRGLARIGAERVDVGLVTGNYFSVMGLAPVAGRLIAAEVQRFTA